jgi:hypothetical protein
MLAGAGWPGTEQNFSRHPGCICSQISNACVLHRRRTGTCNAPPRWGGVAGVSASAGARAKASAAAFAYWRRLATVGDCSSATRRHATCILVSRRNETAM